MILRFLRWLIRILESDPASSISLTRRKRRFFSFFKEPTMAVTFSTLDIAPKAFNVKFKDAGGNLDEVSSIVISVSDPAVVALVIPEFSVSASVVAITLAAVGIVGKAELNVSALNSEGAAVSNSFELDVVAAPAVTIELEAA